MNELILQYPLLKISDACLLRSEYLGGAICVFLLCCESYCFEEKNKPTKVNTTNQYDTAT